MGAGTLRRQLIFLVGLLACSGGAGQQLFQTRPLPRFTHADTLRGMLTPERSCYNLRFYHLDVRIDPAAQFVEGSNAIRFTVDSSFDRMQIDLYSNMAVGKITLDGEGDLPFDRDSNALFIRLPRPLAKGSEHEVKIFYSGNPVVAPNPPWSGGFTWKTDSSGNPWVVVTCQGTGASLWWPNKDHQSDKPDSVLISVTVPPGLMDVSNGRLRAETTLPDGWTRYDWFVSYPINNYNVTINVGKYAHFSDFYRGGRDTLTLDYYVLPGHLEKAKAQFAQVKPMLAAFEKYFGRYPFYRDGYKLIEAPHNGMEHQTAVAYGNRFLEGYVGRASSEVGLKFDFIIVHESSHEWWGNSVTSKDIADMWIHESFGAYAEALYVEERFGREESLNYINAKKQNVRNAEPIIGTYNVQKEGSGDMYDKGQLVLNTLRSVIGADSLWFSILRGLQSTYAYSTITTDSIVGFVNRKTGKDFSYFFEQYLKHPAPPRLEVITRKKGEKVTARYRWAAEVSGFHMPILAGVREGEYSWITPTTDWQTKELENGRPEEFRVADRLFYIDFKLNSGYTDPRLGE
jgi:aminopeptidase N